MKKIGKIVAKSFSTSSIKSTSDNKVVDVSSSLLRYVQSLPKYACKSSELCISKDKSLTKCSTWDRYSVALHHGKWALSLAIHKTECINKRNTRADPYDVKIN